MRTDEIAEKQAWGAYIKIIREGWRQFMQYLLISKAEQVQASLRMQLQVYNDNNNNNTWGNVYKSFESSPSPGSSDECRSAPGGC